jgi:Flp pilus assembly protein TadD
MASRPVRYLGPGRPRMLDFRSWFLLSASLTLTAGCSPPRSRTVTFNQDIAPILFVHCGPCHRPGQQAPFSLLDYRTVRSHAQLIVSATRARLMPPWLPEPGHGEFMNERRLTDTQIRTIQRWVDQGAVEGDPGSKPPIPTWPEGWQLGQPDLIVKLPTPYTLRPDGTDVFRNFVIPMPPSATRYVRAVEFRPDNPRILHHAALGVEPARLSRQLEKDAQEPGFAAMPDDEVKVFGWSPGKAPFMESADRAWLLEGGSDLILEMHMLPTGKPEVIQPTIGLFFTDTPPSQAPLLVKLESKIIDMPAGESDYVAVDTYTLPADVEVQSVYPHAHNLATDMKGMATLPDGTVKWLIWIKAWDFKWQDQYRYAAPLFLPKGTTLTMRFTYDNSPHNPRNPHHPPQRILNGPLSSDEMAVLWLEVRPRNSIDSGLLTKEFVQRELTADVAGAELRVRSDPDQASSHAFLAAKYLRAGRVPEAIDQLTEAVRLEPTDAEAHNNLGNALQMVGKTTEAESHLREALRLKPGDARVHFNLGNVMFAEGRLDEATRQYLQAIKIDPDDADAHYNLAGILGSQHQFDEAIQHLRRTLDIDPRRADAHHNLALALASQGKFDEALGDVRDALKIRPDSAQAQNDLTLLPKLKQQWNSRR